MAIESREVALPTDPSAMAALTEAPVMIVDDQATSRVILSEVVESLRLGATVRGYADPHEALAAAAVEPPLLVITDFRMPNMNGIDFAKALRRLPETADTPIIMVTIVADTNVRARALEAGVTDFLHKPVDRDECRARCRNLFLLGQQMVSLKRTTAALRAEVGELGTIIDRLVPGLRTGALSKEAVAAGELITVEYAQLYQLTSTLKAFGFLVSSAQDAVDHMQAGLREPLYGQAGS